MTIKPVHEAFPDLRVGWQRPGQFLAMLISLLVQSEVLKNFEHDVHGLRRSHERFNETTTSRESCKRLSNIRQCFTFFRVLPIQPSQEILSPFGYLSNTLESPFGSDLGGYQEGPLRLSEPR